MSVEDESNAINPFDKLNERQQIFVLEYIIDFNARRSAIAAGYSLATARQIGYNLLQRPEIKAAMQQAIDERKDRLRLDADKVLLRYEAISNADVNEIVSVRRNNCRYCYGNDNRYQWTVAQYEEACVKAENTGTPAPPCDGGFGFNINGTPNEKCPECQGNGVSVVFIEDTRNLSGEASLMYEGIKTTKDGVQIMMASKSEALNAVARHLGMFKETVNHVSDDGSMTPAQSLDLTNLTDEELRDLSRIVERAEGDNE